jgi:hypothetical protein
MFPPPRLIPLQNIVWMATVIIGIIFCYLGQGYFTFIFLAMGLGLFLFFRTTQGLTRKGKSDRITDEKRL